MPLSIASTRQHRQPRDLHDAALDRVDEAEVGDEPRERAPLRVPARSEVERRGREVDAGEDARLPLPGEAGVVDPVEAGQPDAGLLLLRLQLLLLFPREPLLELDLFLGLRLRPPAVVPLVVQDEDRHPLRQLSEPVEGEGVVRLLPLVDDPIARVPFGVLALQRQGVPVRDEDLPLAQVVPVLRRHQVELVVVVVRNLGPEHLQAPPHRQVRADDEDRPREVPRPGVPAAVAERPGDEHSHDDRLPRPRRHLAAEARQRQEVGIGRPVDERRVLEEAPIRDLFPPRLLPLQEEPHVLVGHLEVLEPRPARSPREPQLEEVDRRLHRLPLAEEEPPRLVASPPPREEVLRDGRGAPVPRLPPALHVLPQLVDERQVLAALLGEEVRLRAPGPLALRPVACRPPARVDRRHAVHVEPVRLRFLVRRREDRVGNGLDGSLLPLGKGRRACHRAPPLTLPAGRSSSPRSRAGRSPSPRPAGASPPGTAGSPSRSSP